MISLIPEVCGTVRSVASCWLISLNSNRCDVNVNQFWLTFTQGDLLIMSIVNDLVDKNRSYASKFQDSELPMPPSKHVAVVACMDARMMVSDFLGIENGEAHIIRNAGGIVNEETLRSLLISTRLLGTREIVVINHTDCGMLTFKDADFLESLRQDAEVPVDPILFYAFSNLDENVAWQVSKIKSYPLLPKDISVRGFIYDVKSGALREVEPKAPPLAADAS